MQEDTDHDFVSRTRVHIQRPIATVWPLLRDLGAWKEGGAPRHHAGTPGAEGEVLLAHEGPVRDDGSRLRLWLKVLRQQPPQQLVLKLWTEGGDPARGYADLSLHPAPGGCEFVYSVFVQTRSLTLTPAEHAVASENIRAESEARFVREHLRLKALAEGVA
ncbi:MAG: SRPBCC family protein [Ideonella sp.]|nr:SRPBCC family protein [Ideonella sp.]